MVSWLKQIKKKATAPERGMNYANPNEKPFREAASGEFGSSNKAVVGRDAGSDQRISAQHVESDSNQATRRGKVNEGGNRCQKNN